MMTYWTNFAKSGSPNGVRNYTEILEKFCTDSIIECTAVDSCRWIERKLSEYFDTEFANGRRVQKAIL